MFVGGRTCTSLFCTVTVKGTVFPTKPHVLYARLENLLLFLYLHLVHVVRTGFPFAEFQYFTHVCILHKSTYCIMYRAT